VWGFEINWLVLKEAKIIPEIRISRLPMFCARWQSVYTSMWMQLYGLWFSFIYKMLEFGIRRNPILKKQFAYEIIFIFCL